MSIIKSGASSDQWTIDPTSKAGRITLYDAAGNCLSPTENARASVIVQVTQAGTDAAGTIIWGLKNASATLTIQVLRLSLQLLFSGTGAATLMAYEALKYTGVTSMTGGSVNTPAILKTSLSQGTAYESRFASTGLTLTGGTAGGLIHMITLGRLTPSATVQSSGPQHILDFSELGMGPLELAQNEVLALRLTNTAVSGDAILGSVLFIEKAN